MVGRSSSRLARALAVPILASLTLSLAVLGPLPTGPTTALGAEPATFSVDPRRTYLRTNSPDAPLDALKIDLAALGIASGKLIRLERLGAWDCGGPCTDSITAMSGVFSAGDVLLPTTQPHRVPGAIDAGVDVVTGPTFFGALPTDIPEDFAISETAILVPTGATHLFVGTTDSFFSDNSDPNRDFQIRITVLDSTPPEIVPTIAGTLGGGGWHVSDVTASWSVTDPESAVSSTSGCDASTLTDDTAGTTLTCTATSEGGTASESVTIKIDQTAPIVTGSRSPGGNEHGWNNADVTVSFDCSDALSGIATCTEAVTLTDEGTGQAVTGTATDVAGNEASATVDEINIDRTPPTVVYAGNAGTYTVDEQIAITCTAADALSGLDSHSCADVSGPAYAFPLGTSTYSAWALDLAGNEGFGSTTITVLSTSSSLCELTREFSSNPVMADSLCAKLDAAAAAEERGNLSAEEGLLGAYVNEVQAQSGKAFTAEEAVILVALAGAL